VVPVAKKKPAKKKSKKKHGNVEAIVASLEKTPVVKKLTAEEKEFAEKLEKLTQEVDHVLATNEEVQKLKKEIKDKPLTYAALAFTAGIALGALLKGRH
jgi:DNA replication initiation complex subunit (GINS family)